VWGKSQRCRPRCICAAMGAECSESQLGGVSRTQDTNFAISPCLVATHVATTNSREVRDLTRRDSAPTRSRSQECITRTQAGVEAARGAVFGSVGGSTPATLERITVGLARSSGLLRQRCVPCEGGVPALTAEEAAGYLVELGAGWGIVDGQHLEQEYGFADFREALGFVNQVAEVAESEGHHPDILLGWGKVKILLWTYAAGGLTKNDFILAAKITQLSDRG